ncbi:hypothetical protein RH915_09915 [Serpentinicella sp. ANB-PHB4]|uniref:hypothetical protein n=1 Tax=Serpentinicella sp. ANB-PHB4 TaxID=3074076 RepID=UPI0028627745|nr:hypothetical protein [Serpentinicella sp. ANB-PHB4]MDR5659813.1 hypothetical protein [Serpentinicella sp. ANB-PHB4]
MEKLAWMRKIDGSMDKVTLLQLMDSMHELIDELLEQSQKKDLIIQELKGQSK